MAAENPLERAALQNIARGWSAIPLRFSGTVEDRKKPLLQSWAEYQKRLPTEEEVKDWWRQWPSANLGTPTGLVSGLAVVDLDGRTARNSSGNEGFTSRKPPRCKLAKVIRPIMRILAMSKSCRIGLHAERWRRIASRHSRR